MKPELLLKGGAPSRNKMVARLLLPVVDRFATVTRSFERPWNRCRNTPHDTFCNFYFRVARSAGKILDRMAVVVSREEIHIPEVGAVSENFVHHADTLAKFRPVEGGNRAHAGDDVSDGAAHCSVLL